MDSHVGRDRSTGRSRSAFIAALPLLGLLAATACDQSAPRGDGGVAQTFTFVCEAPGGAEVFREARATKGHFSIDKDNSRVQRPGESEFHRFSGVYACRSWPNPR